VTYADTDFFLAILKETDWLKSRARRMLLKHKKDLWTSPVTAIELLLLADRTGLDAERLILDMTQIAELRGIDARILLAAAHYMKEHSAHTFDALHAAFCDSDSIISSDKIFDRIGLRRIPLEDQRAA
jgi:predicted nucleic acid-binding protein